MKILIFPGGYIPGTKYGGILTSKENFVEVFGDEHDMFIVAPNHDYKENIPYAGIKSGWNKVGKAKVLYISDDESNILKYEKIINEIKPNLIYLSGTITSYFRLNRFLIRIARKRKIPVLISSDGDICTNALRISMFKKMCAILLVRMMRAYDNVYFQATSKEETINLMKYLGIQERKIFEVTNVPGCKKSKSNLIKQVGTLQVIFISRICRKKNLIDAIKSVSHFKCGICLDIYGPIEDKDYWNECQYLIKHTGSSNHIKYIGELDPIKAKEIFSKYDCFLFPTMSENYGYVIEEALLCGCPVITTKDVTPWDDIDGKAGYVEELGNISGICHRLEELACMDNEKYALLRKAIDKYISERLRIKGIKDDYQRMFRTVIS